MRKRSNKVEERKRDGGDRGAKALGKAEEGGREDETITQSMGETPGLTRLREAAKRNRRLRFTNLLHHMTPERLRSAYDALNRRGKRGRPTLVYGSRSS